MFLKEMPSRSNHSEKNEDRKINIIEMIDGRLFLIFYSYLKSTNTQRRNHIFLSEEYTNDYDEEE